MTLNNGFLLAEVAVVLAVVSLLIGVSVPTLQLFDRSIIRSEIERLVGVINYAQHRALLTGQAQKIKFSNHGYSVDASEYELPAQVILGLCTGAQPIAQKPQHAIEQAVTFAYNTIVCQEQGIANGGTVYFTNRDRTMSYAFSLPVGSCYRNIYAWSDSGWVLQ